MATTAPQQIDAITLAKITAAHADTTGQILSRIRIIDAAMAAGYDVKSITAELKANNGVHVTVGSSDVVIRPVSQQTLGRARAVRDILDGFGVSVATAAGIDRDFLASLYKSVFYHGIKPVRAAVIPAAIAGGDTPAAKVAAAKVVTDRLVASAPEITRKVQGETSPESGAGQDGTGSDDDTMTNAGSQVASTADQRVTALLRAMGTFTADAANGGVKLTAAQLGKLSDMLAEMTATLATVVPAPAMTVMVAPETVAA